MVKLNLDLKRARQAADIKTFIAAYGRKKRSGGLDPNDRRYDLEVKDTLAHLKPEELDALLRDDERDS